ncbi:leukocyte cell-derived chemotaxin 1 [Lingula anatina]|uniref:Leukocyte cell-derived chemotaxin 1 n=1 Tax=Lingula anatina TaxID=7574 RepID=A0A1S3K893_LINAN|nr:leukocyte cell-derived chemotaxin 1 [Lingula anatina]|eukprot:XP_013418476.1 leukocyte cell-derived chemotaxin 1 [Lingula anatina]
MKPDTVLSTKMFNEPQEMARQGESKSSNKKKFAIGAVTLVIVVAMAVGGVLLATHMSQKASNDMLKAYLVTFKDDSSEFQQEIEISASQKLEAVHVAAESGKQETFVLHDYSTGKTALRFAGDTSCYIRSMEKRMTRTNVTGLQQSYQEAQHQTPGKISSVEQSYYQAVDAPVDRSSLSKAVLDFCAGHKLQFLEKTTKENIKATATSKSRSRRDLFDNFSALATRKFSKINARLGSNDDDGKKSGGDVGAASFGGPPPPPPPRDVGAVVPLGNAYGPDDPYLNNGGVGGRKDPYQGGGHADRYDSHQGGGHADPYDSHQGGHVDPYEPHHGGYQQKQVDVPCQKQSACKVNEGCTVRTDRTCEDYGWFFGNRGGVGRGRYLDDARCLRWRYVDVKDCVIVNKCEDLCT